MIINRLKNLTKTTNNKELAKKLGLNDSAVSTWSARNTLNYQTIINYSILNNFDLNYIFKDEESHNFNENIKNIVNNKIFVFPLKAIVAFIFLLEKNENIKTIENLIEKIEEFFQGFNIIKFNLTTTDFTTKLDKKNLIYCAKYLLDDFDVETIFSNKDYYIEYLNFVKKSKRWI